MREIDNNFSTLSITVCPQEQQLADGLLYVQLIGFYLLIPFVSVAFGGLICVGIVRHRRLRTRFVVIVGCLTFCRSSKAVQLIVLSVYRLLAMNDYAAVCMQRAVCCCLHFCIIVLCTQEMVLLFLMVLDRCLAVARPYLYKTLTWKSAFYGCLIVGVTVMLIKLMYAYSSTDFGDRVSCLNSNSALSYSFNVFSHVVEVLFATLIVLAYVVLIVYVRGQCQKLRRNPNRNCAQLLSLERHLKLMPVLRNFMLIHSCFSLTSRILSTISVFQTVSVQSQYTNAIGGIVSSVDICINVLLPLAGKSELRTVICGDISKMVAKIRRLLSIRSASDPIPHLVRTSNTSSGHI